MILVSIFYPLLKLYSGTDFLSQLFGTTVQYITLQLTTMLG
jgi:hypothetical protein